MPRYRTILILLAAATLGGCHFWPFGSSVDSATPHVASTPPVLPPAPRPTNPEEHPTQPVAKVHLLKLTMPLGTFSLNEKVWRQLDEDALGSKTSVLLAQNGLRAGVGPQARWAAIAKLIDLPGSSTQEFFCQTDGRSSVNIVTRANIAEQTVFYVDQDLQLQGRTFGGCDNAVRLSMNKVKDSTDLTIQLEPIVQVGTVNVIRGAQELGIVHVTAPLEETFKNLRLAASLKADQFLIISPADPKSPASAFSVGTRFLTEADKVPPLETVLVLVPMLDEKK